MGWVGGVGTLVGGGEENDAFVCSNKDDMEKLQRQWEQ